jgi:V8-like Glu-specific endopeptidase
MINLVQADRTALIDAMVNCPILQSERGREAVIESAGLQELRPHVDLSGLPLVVLPLLLRALLNYGKLSYGQEALGAFLATLRNYAGPEQRRPLDLIVEKYGLTALTAESPQAPDWPTPALTSDLLEKIIGENTLRPIAFLEQALVVARSVAYIEVTSNHKRWSGTGFLIAPNLLLTNHHVLWDQALLSASLFRFNYQLDSRGNPVGHEDYQAVVGGVFRTNATLDYSVVELSGRPGDRWGHLTLTRTLPDRTERIYIIQHPNGLPKQIALQNNRVKYVSASKIQYVTSTLPGSSGSPVFNGAWAVTGLHHAGGDLPEEDTTRLYFRNEAIAMGAIIDNLDAHIQSQVSIL